jgi:hypothetical protein
MPTDAVNAVDRSACRFIQRRHSSHLCNRCTGFREVPSGALGAPLRDDIGRFIRKCSISNH